VSAAWDPEDVSATLKGLFDLRLELSGIRHDVEAIRRLLEDDEEEDAPEDS
jgi:hypothetical protein